MNEEEIKISRRSSWSSIQNIVGMFLVIIGVLAIFLGDNIFERISAVIIVFCGIQSLFVAFLIDVFTDIRWFLSNLNSSSELTNNYLGHQYRKSQVAEQKKSKGLAKDCDGEGEIPEW
jgi:hypothetical protein